MFYTYQFKRPELLQLWLVHTCLSSIVKSLTSGEVPEGDNIFPFTNSWFGSAYKVIEHMGVNVICYADDTLVVMAENDISTLGRKVNTALEAMTRWIE